MANGKIIFFAKSYIKLNMVIFIHYLKKYIKLNTLANHHQNVWQKMNSRNSKQFKWFSILIGLLFIQFSLNAQSLIKIDANWQAGDTMKYTIKDYVVEYIKDSRADTLLYIEKEIAVVVVDSSKYGYILQWQAINLKTEGAAKGPIIKKDIKMEYRTDAYGLVEEILNWETIRKLVFDEIENIVDNELTESDLIYWGNNAVQSAYQLGSREGVVSLYAKDLQMLHFNYGTQYEVGELVSYNNHFPVTFGNGTVNSTGQLLCELTDTTITIKANSATDETELKNYYISVLKELNGKVPAREKRKIKQQELFIKSVRNYIYDKESLSLLKGTYNRTQLIEGIYTSNIVEVELEQ